MKREPAKVYYYSDEHDSESLSRDNDNRGIETQSGTAFPIQRG